MCYLGAEKIVLTQECVYVIGHLSEWLNEAEAGTELVTNQLGGGLSEREKFLQISISKPNPLSNSVLRNDKCFTYFIGFYVDFSFNH